MATRQRRFQLTERDLEMAAFIDRVGRATVAQMRERFELSERVAWRRVQALEESRCIRSVRLLTAPKVLYPAGSAAPEVREFDHSLTTTSVVVGLERGGLAVVTERTMRRDERAQGQSGIWSIGMPGSSFSNRPCTHRPDLAIQTASGLVAIEVELSVKGRARLRRLMAAWTRQGRYTEVRYLCSSPRVQGLVSEEARRAGGEGVITTAVLNARHRSSFAPRGGAR